MTWVADQEWSDDQWAGTHRADIEAILARNAHRFITVKKAPWKQDAKQATDFTIVTDRGDIAWRIRREDCRYRQLTLRLRRRPWGALNAQLQRGYEADKIIRGHARWYLYAWTR